MSKQSKSLLFVIILALIIAGAAYAANQKLAAKDLKQAETAAKIPVHQAETPPPAEAEPPVAEPLPAVDTTTWKSYVSRGYPFTFKYPEKWKAVPNLTNTDYDMIVVTPNDEQTQMTIYLSKTGFLGMEGLKSLPITVSTVDGINVQNMLVGLKYLDTFYTYDLGNSSHKAEFMAIVNSTQFLPKK